MKQYKDLDEQEKLCFKTIENIYLGTSLSRNAFVKVLGVLINKWKRG